MKELQIDDYNPWGKPGHGAPNEDTLRKRKIFMEVLPPIILKVGSLFISSLIKAQNIIILLEERNIIPSGEKIKYLSTSASKVKNLLITLSRLFCIKLYWLIFTITYLFCLNSTFHLENIFPAKLWHHFYLFFFSACR